MKCEVQTLCSPLNMGDLGLIEEDPNRTHPLHRCEERHCQPTRFSGGTEMNILFDYHLSDERYRFYILSISK